MKKLELSDIKKIQIEILKEFSKYCDENGLVYFLGYGTLLGAVRHKGYIPWDDDIDIIMPRGDYDKFIYRFCSDNKKLELLDISNEPNYTFPFAKISDSSTILQEDYAINFNRLGVNVDIFPIDGAPKNKEEADEILRKVKFYRNMLKVKYAKVSTRKNFLINLIAILGKILLYFVDYRNLLRKIDTISRRFKFNQNNDAGCLVWNYGAKEIMSKDIFSKSIKIEFENEFYNAPEKYDEYLKNLYGDYMTLPSEDKRVTHHTFKAYWR
jgi:lipopolysaccharide cholinephosphotransferase